MGGKKKLPVGVEPIERAGGRVSYRARVRDSVTGQRYSESFDTPEAAAAWRVRRLREIDAAYQAEGIETNRRIARRDAPTTMSELLTVFMAQYTGNARSTLSTQDRGRKLVDYFGAERRITDVDRPFVREFMLSMLRNHVARPSRDHGLSLLRRMLDLAVEYRVITDNPAVGVKSEAADFDPVDSATRPPTSQELIMLTYYLPAWLWPAVFLASDAGLRASEVCGLRWSSVDLENHRVWVADVITRDGEERGFTKSRGGRGRGRVWLPLSPRAVEALTVLHASHPPPYDNARVFRSPAKAHMPYSTLANYFWRARAAVIDPSLPLRFRFHDLRHYTGHRGADAGMPVHVLMELMRHTTPRMTHHYMGRPDYGLLENHHSAAFQD